MHRVTSELFVSALIRRVAADGGFAAVLRRGARDAGAVFVIERDRMGNERLFGPAPQSGYDEERPGDRMFAVAAEGDSDIVSSRVDKELRFDGDLWLVEVECGGKEPGDYLTIMTP